MPPAAHRNGAVRARSTGQDQQAAEAGADPRGRLLQPPAAAQCPEQAVRDHAQLGLSISPDGDPTASLEALAAPGLPPDGKAFFVHSDGISHVSACARCLGSRTTFMSSWRSCQVCCCFAFFFFYFYRDQSKFSFFLSMCWFTPFAMPTRVCRGNARPSTSTHPSPNASSR